MHGVMYLASDASGPPAQRSYNTERSSFHALIRYIRKSPGQSTRDDIRQFLDFSTSTMGLVLLVHCTVGAVGRISTP